MFVTNVLTMGYGFKNIVIFSASGATFRCIL